MAKTKGSFYAVARGHTVGIFKTWDECKTQVNGFPNARYKKFNTQKEASNFVTENKNTGVSVIPMKEKAKKLSVPVCHTSGESSSSKPVPFFRLLTTKAPAWKKNYKHDIHKIPATTTAGVQNVRGISTSTTLADFRKRLRVTEDVVVANKIFSHDDGQFSFNSDADLNNFNIDEEGYVVVYTDGACRANGKNGAKAGVGVWFGEDHELNYSEPVKGRQTNNTAEIQAAEIAVSQAKKAGVDKLCIKTDSQFVINCITKWVNKWIKNGWILSDGKPVINKEDLLKLMALQKGIKIKWSYVKAHNGIRGNEEADRLAVEGAQKRIKLN